MVKWLVLVVAALCFIDVGCTSSQKKATSTPASIVPTGKARKLGTYHSHLHRTSVSGQSSGAAMAIQMHVAYSSIMTGAASFAGSPFHCAMDQKSRVNTVCTKDSPPINVNSLIKATKSMEKKKLIDSTKHLNSSHVLIFQGGLDQKVLPAVKDSLVKYYKHFITNFARQVKVEDRFGIGHTFPTFGESAKLKNCAHAKPPFVGSCGYDGAMATLLEIYGVSHSRWEGPLSTIPGNFIRFDQTEFIQHGHGMGPNGLVFVPDACSATRNTTQQRLCPVHVAFHGCGQSIDSSTAFVEQTGFIQAAVTNDIIVLFPQARSVKNSTDDNECWDWWGYSGKGYDTQQGIQMKAVREMISRLTGTSPRHHQM